MVILRPSSAEGSLFHDPTKGRHPEECGRALRVQALTRDPSLLAAPLQPSKNPAPRFAILRPAPPFPAKEIKPMKTWLIVVALLSAPVCGYAQAKPCEELKSEIAAKLDAKNVKGYSLEIVEKNKEVTTGTVVGTCEGGTKKIIYTKSAG
jgi:hypothetical protein